MKTIEAQFKNGGLKLPNLAGLQEGQKVHIKFIEPSKLAEPELDAESRAWVDANLSQKLLPYNWGKGGIPKGNPVEYDPEHGMVVIEK